MVAKTPTLDLSPEVSQVVSRDFNLFFKPEQAPEDTSVDVFAKELVSFNNNVVNPNVINAEVKEKKVNEAEAVKAYNENRMNFNKAVEANKLPAEINPYFIDKYKGLELNDQAQKFKSHLYNKYGELGVKDNTNPEAFSNFYKDTLKEYLKNNQLGSYSPELLNDNFFKKTDGIREQLNSVHLGQQLSEVQAGYKKKAINKIQGFFENDGESDFYKRKGKELSDDIKSMVANGLSKQKSQDYLLEALQGFVEGADDIDEARKLLNEMPKHIQLGTGAFADIKGLKDEFSKLNDALDDREANKEKKEIQKYNNQVNLDKIKVRRKVDSPDFDYQEYTKTDEFKNLTNSAKQNLKEYVNISNTAFSTKDNIDVTDTLDNYLKKGNYDEAEQYLLDTGKNHLTEKTFKEYRNNLTIYSATDKDGSKGLLTTSSFRNQTKAIQNKITVMNKNGTVIDPRASLRYESWARRWILENKKKYQNSNTDFSDTSLEFEEAFEKASTEKFTRLYNSFSNSTESLETIFAPAVKADLSKLGSKNSATSTPTTTQTKNSKTEKFDPNKLPVIIPQELLKRDRRQQLVKKAEYDKFISQNPNAISQSEYDKQLSKNKINPSRRQLKRNKETK